MGVPVDILVFSPHPDDAELGCGGSMILAADQKLGVAVADLSEGERSSRGTEAQRMQERNEAIDLLGLSERFSVGLPDTEIGQDPRHRLALIQLIRETRPRIVLAPHWNDRHPDHAAAGKLVQEACFYAGVAKVGKGRPHRPERLYYYMLHYLLQPFIPSFVIDISAVWERKMAAVTAYGSQFQSKGGASETALSQPEFLRFIEVKAAWFGAMVGVAYGEAFYLPGPVSLPGFPGLAGPPLQPGKLPPYSMY